MPAPGTGMTRARPVIGYLHERCLITGDLAEKLARIGDLRLVEPTTEGLADVDILCTFAGFWLDADLLATTPRLRATIDLGTAIHTDVAAASDRGVVVFHAPGANAQAVAEHTVGLMLALCNGMMRSDRRMRSGEFKLAHRRTWGFELGGRTLGLVGFGNVARRVAHIAKNGLDMRVIAWCRRPGDALDAGIEFAELGKVMSESDVVSVHLALNPQTRGFVTRDLIDSMRPGAYIVVTARVEVLDLDALTERVVDGHLAGAALDTWPRHVPDYDSPLLRHDNVVLTEANAGLTDIAAENMADAVLDAVRSTLTRTMPSVATVANVDAWPPRPLAR